MDFDEDEKERGEMGTRRGVDVVVGQEESWRIVVSSDSSAVGVCG